MKSSKQFFEIDKVTEKRIFKNRKGEEIVQFKVKWKGYDNLYNQWVDEANIIEIG